MALARNTFLTAVLLFIFVLDPYAQSIRHVLGNPVPGNAVFSRQQTDVFAFAGNQAALVSFASATAGIFAERRFMLAENSFYAVAAAFPSRVGNLGLQLRYSGFKQFNENEIGLAYARKLGNKVAVGIQFNYYRYSVPSYGNMSSVNAEIGFIVHITDKLSAGVHCYNPVSVKLGKSVEKLASVYSFGLGFDASAQFYAGVEVVKQEDNPVNVNGVLRYQFGRRFFARAGFQSTNSEGFGGAGVSWKSMRLEIIAGYHPQLGISPGLMLMMSLKEKK